MPQVGIRWLRHDFISDPPPALDVDLIFLWNNLLTYYLSPVMLPAFFRILAALRTGGLLVIGLTEALPLAGFKQFLIKAIDNKGVPEKITIDGSVANKSALEEYNCENGTSIEIRQVKDLNNIIEQDHQGVKRITNSMLGFKSLDSASITY